MELDRVWFQFIGADTSAESRIRTGLAESGIGLCPLESGAGAAGITCFTDVDDNVLRFFRETRQRTRGLVMALAATPAALKGEDTWRLLHAGAAETLIWTDTGPTLNQIRSRLERWHAVDRLAEEATARQRLIGSSPAWRALVRRVVEAAHFTDAPMLLIGESGTGKELLSRLIHSVNKSSDQRATKRDLVTVDCSTIVPELSGSEFFGHERGAFTGAVNQRDGAFALVAGGTLFLDEVGELALPLQAQLLRAVQEKTYKRVGGNVWHTTDFNLVCATNRDLTELVKSGHFRLDLYHRIAGWVFQIPPLRERREDILSLAAYFLATARPQEEPLEFDPSVRDYLLNREYPGNVRELAQLIQRIANRHVGPGPITAGDIPEEDRPALTQLRRSWPDELLEKTIEDAITLGVSLKEISQAATETAIRVAVRSENGSLQRAARRLDVTDRALQMRRASGKNGG